MLCVVASAIHDSPPLRAKIRTPITKALRLVFSLPLGAVVLLGKLHVAQEFVVHLQQQKEQISSGQQNVREIKRQKENTSAREHRSRHRDGS